MRGNTLSGQRGSRHMAAARGDHLGTQCLDTMGKQNLSHEPHSKLMKSGAHVSKHLSFGCMRKAVWGNAMVANRTREIRPSGMKRGAYGNVGYG